MTRANFSRHSLKKSNGAKSGCCNSLLVIKGGKAVKNCQTHSWKIWIWPANCLFFLSKRANHKPITHKSDSLALLFSKEQGVWFVHSRSFAKINESDKLRIALLKEQFGAKERRSKEGREKERIHKPELSIQFVYQKLSENVGLCWISSSVLRKCKKVTPGHLFYRG